MAYKLLSANIAKAVPLAVTDGQTLSAIGKRGVQGALAVNKLGLAGDEQANPSVHGGLDKAVYAYPFEHYVWWQQQRIGFGATHGAGFGVTSSGDLPFGFMGENLTLEGLLETDVWVGDRLHFPNCVLRVTEPREPCHKFIAVMGFAKAARLMTAHKKTGWYLAVDAVGQIETGQSFTLERGTNYKIDGFRIG